ncbi:LysR family transcriptional regulator [Mesorhizobium sp. SB112]|uniref:LysR family transcriptional regulator n=1 Tax=Mesorhizobium sp. SB112 TaxID=3151853 RepID=UPI00326415C7
MDYLNAVTVFRRVVELGNLSAAGRDLRMDAARVSTLIVSLEATLQARLLNRSTRRLIPTEHGMVFYAAAGKIIDNVAAAEAAVADMSGQPSGTIRLSVPQGLGRRIIGPAIPKFCDRHTGIHVQR